MRCSREASRARATFEENVRRASDLALDIVGNPLKYHDLEANKEKKEKVYTDFNYYSHSEATLGRYTLLPVADGVVDAALNLGTTGMYTITPGFEMSLPRFLYPDKPFANMGNFLAHREPGLLPNKRDVTTGITVGFFADAFTSFGWLGVSLIPCLIMFFFQAIYSCLIGGRIWQNAVVTSLVAVIWGFFRAGHQQPDPLHPARPHRHRCGPLRPSTAGKRFREDG